MRIVMLGLLTGLVVLVTGLASAQNLVLRFRVPGLDGAASAGAGSAPPLTPDTSGAFITVWDTTRPGIVNDRTVTPPVINGYGGTHDFSLDCGETAVERIKTVTNLNLGDARCEFPLAGTYTLTITSATGQMGGWTFNNGGDRQKLIEIQGWGPFRFGLRAEMDGEFEGASNLAHVTASDVPTLQGPYLSLAFFGNGSLTGIQNINDWDTSGVTNMRMMFTNAALFNGDLSGWNTGSVSNMSAMFMGAAALEADISGWDTGEVTDMATMFASAARFNADISGWDTRKVLNMGMMFYGAADFDRDLTLWETGEVNNMSAMFRDAAAFNGAIEGWDTSGVNNMSRMFQDAANFDRDLSCWDVRHNPTHDEFDTGADMWDADHKPQFGINVSTDPACAP